MDRKNHSENAYLLDENRIGILIIFGVIIIYHIIVFETGIMTGLPVYVSNTFFIFMILPGFFSAFTYAIFKKKPAKIIIVGFLTILCWYIWFIIYGLMTFTIK
jgi:uncharacterized protein YqhQ